MSSRMAEHLEKVALVAGGKFGTIFFLGLLLLEAACVSLINGQQDGVSLKIRGATIPNDSFVDLDDIMYTAPDVECCSDPPSNTNPRDEALLCVTDLVDCCGAPRTVRGDWYYPDGRRVELDPAALVTFRANRGPNVQENGQTQSYGSVRLFRRYGRPPGRGRFCCELPSIANSNVNYTLYANIVDFGFSFDIDPVAISPSGSSIAGESYSLICSATLFDPVTLPSDVPSPYFQWSFNSSSSLLSGVTPTATTVSSSNSSSKTYTSALQFSPLSQSHTGMYTCRLGAGRLVNTAMVTVNAPILSVEITTSGAPVLGQSGYSLTCNVSGANHLSLSTTYQWTKNNGTQTQIQVGADPNVLSFSPLRLSDAGRYTCRVTVSSPYLSNDITMMSSNSQDIMLQVPAPTSVTLSSSIANPIPPFGSDVTLSCSVLTSGSEIDVPLNVNFELLRTDPAGSPLITTTPSVSGSTYITTAIISSFERSDSGVYTCRATASSMSINTYINDSNIIESNSIRVTTGVYLALRGIFIANNSNIIIRNIGQSSDSPNGALQCITDRMPCCFSQNPRLGEWYLPNRTLIQGGTSTTAFYRSRGDSGEVSLNRPSDVTSPFGLFCCVVPNASDIKQILCVNIGEIIITPSGSPIAGESYTLECSAGGSEGTFQWIGPPDGSTPVDDSPSNANVVSNATSSQLQFRHIGQSNNGSYLCTATVGGLTLLSAPVDISVNAPSISVRISDGGVTPTTGENYRLTCIVSGAENLNPTTTYQWMKNSGSGQTPVGTSSNTLSFTLLQLSDAANYICTVTIASSYLTGDIVVMNSQDVRIRIPTQSSITLTSSIGNSGVQIVGSDVTLTCTVGLSSVIQSSEILLLAVDAQLSRDGIPLTLTSPIVTGTILTYTRRFEPFMRDDSGNYTCIATVRPQPSLTYITGNETIQSTSVSIKAVSAPPLNIRATQSSSSAPVEVSWSPPSDGDATIIGYRIFYGNGQNISVQIIPSLNDVTLTVRLGVNANYVGQNVSLRSETDQLYSELVNITVTWAIMAMGCSSEIGITVGVIIVVVCLVVMVITIIVILCLWRKKSSHSDKFAVLANMAYGQVSLKLPEREDENPDKSGQQTETVTTATYEAIDTYNDPMGPEYVYARVDEAVCTTSEQ